MNYNVYINLDEKDSIVYITSDYENDNVDNLTLIDTGSTDEYKYASKKYLINKHDNALFDMDFRPNFKYENGVIAKYTDEERETLYPREARKPTELEKLKEQQERTEQAVQDLILMTMGGGE